MPNVFDARILIADDEPANVLLLESLLRKVGYRDLVTTTDARRVLPLFLDRAPDLLLLDLMMPHLDGHAVLNQVVPRVPADDYLPILVITADSTAETERRALAARLGLVSIDRLEAEATLSEDPEFLYVCEARRARWIEGSTTTSAYSRQSGSAMRWRKLSAARCATKDRAPALR